MKQIQSLEKHSYKEEFQAFNEWPEYGLTTRKFIVNKQDTGLQAIYKNGNFVKMLSQKYQVVPNEDVLKIADKIAKNTKLNGDTAVPLTVAPKEWFYIKPQDHVIMNQAQTQACAMYVFPKPFDVDGKEIKIGFVARNSIDGAWSFSASVLSFRTVCQNMMLHIAKTNFLGIGSGDYLGVQNDQDLSQMRDHQVQALSSVSRRHTKALGDLTEVDTTIQSVVDAGLKTVQRYRELANAKLNMKIANQIAHYVPKTVTKDVDWLDINKGKITVDEKISQWKAFNDLTEKLTHESKNFRMTLLTMQRMDKIFGTSV